MASATTSAPSFIDPRCVYTHRGFIAASGISQTRMREAGRRGVHCRRFWVGKRAFYRGADIIEYLEQLAADDVSQANLANQTGACDD